MWGGFQRDWQVISGKKYWSDGTPVAGQQFEYSFDDIGNRTGTKAGGDENGVGLRSAAYSANNVNQYTSRDVPGAVDVMGIAFATNTVTVNGQGVHRKGEYFRKELSVNNAAAAVWTNITVNAAGQSPVSGNALFPKTPETFAFDADGNLVQDGLWLYTWDAENRLVSMQSVSSVPSAAKRRLDFAYDWRGCRISKTVSNDVSGVWQLESDLRFVYDGWNLIAVLSSDLCPLTFFAWGTDLSGSLQGAGGVGGLLWMTIPSGTNAGTYFHAYDGNGNVMALVSAADGSVAARYEYGPFGEPLRATGPMAKTNPFRFSTKYQDDETGLLYYGYRYYDPSTGRWLRRDPIDERGGRNLYGFVRNNPVSAIDNLGLVTGSFNVQFSAPQFGEGLAGWSVRFDWRPPSSWPRKCAPCEKVVWVQDYRFHSDFYWTLNWVNDWHIANYGGNSTPWVNGTWPRGHRLDFSEMWDDPSVSGPILAWSSTIRFQAESCVRCVEGPEKYKWYGCYLWGYSVVNDNLTGGIISGPHDGPTRPFHW